MSDPFPVHRRKMGQPARVATADPNCPTCKGTGTISQGLYDPPAQCDCWDRHQPSDPKTGVGVILVHHSFRGIWMNQRTGSRDYNGYWQVPGGTVEPLEDTISAARRELSEETGLWVPPGRLNLIYKGYFTKPSGEVYLSEQFSCVCNSTDIPENREPDKATPWQLVEWSVIPTLLTFDSVKEIFKP